MTGLVVLVLMLTIILVLNVPLSCQHVLLCCVATLNHTQDRVMRGRRAAAHGGLRSQYIVPTVVGEDGTETGRGMALVHRHCVSMVFQHARVQIPVRLLFARTPFGETAVARSTPATPSMVTRRIVPV